MLTISSVLIKKIQIPEGGFANPVAKSKEQAKGAITFADAIRKVSEEKTS